MTTDWTSFLQHLGNTIVDAFVLPGQFILSWSVKHNSDIAASLGIGEEPASGMLLVVISLLIWLLLATVVWNFLKLLQNVSRNLNAVIRTIAYRVSLTLRNFKTMLVCCYRRFLRLGISNRRNSLSATDLDELDLAVLRATAALGPGFAVSAPDLADEFTLRPAQVQRSLDKLSRKKMLDYVIGSTDGYDNYRLTESGNAFVTSCRRKATSW